ncbi:MAG TPA: magnesium-translocating P-type ATPase [Chlamydiales bacterium]|nr:magnesium-translocating P-type ATPase [Chlamydiales bacterium]
MESYCQKSLDELFAELKSRKEGLSTKEARSRLGQSAFDHPKKWKRWSIFLSQINNPLILILLGAAILSLFLGSVLDASMILMIIAASAILGYFQERGAVNALEEILQKVQNKVIVRRNGQEEEINAKEVVHGDILILNAGDLIPGDCRLTEGAVFVDESSLTGESMPIEKNEQESELFHGSMIFSGMGVAVVVKTGKETKFGKIIQESRFRPPETSFEIGVRHFGFFLTMITFLFIVMILALNLFFSRPFLESVLFAIALAVGLTPQLLPAIISVNLARGAKRMARKKVLVKRLPSIENFGQMDILCTDKTGTLTVGKLTLKKAVDIYGNDNDECRQLAFLNASLQSGYTNPLDQAIKEMANPPDIHEYQKSDEIPFNFDTKRVSVLVKYKEETILITKGAIDQILSICALETQQKQTIHSYFEKVSQEGFRTIAIAKGKEKKEEGLTFVGFLQFIDPIKEDSASAISELYNMGVGIKIITGDHHAVARHTAESCGYTEINIVTGEELKAADEASFAKLVQEKNIFAEILPGQKKQIVLALRKTGDTIGFLGDGINDVAGIHSADVGISVDSGTEAAKEAADIVLLEKDLHALKEGVLEGRHTFANTLKYIYMATSANFGNMFSMAAFSLFLPYLPMLPKQVLLINLLTDLPEMCISTDKVDPEMVEKPTEWNLRFIRKFMFIFGLLSSVFDFATFGVLLYFLKADRDVFRTGWFIESVMSATLIVLVIRTRRSIFKSRPSKTLALALIGTALGVIAIPYTSFGTAFGFVPIPIIFYLPLSGILVLYLILAEVIKRCGLRPQEALNTKE